MAALMLVFFSSEALPWGWAVHAYIDDDLGRKRGLSNINEIYGGMVPDLFNYMFANPDYLGYLSYQTHNEFMKVWTEARCGSEKSLAYGFVSHNDVWGADSTAHHSGRTFGQAQGYVIAKAELLKPIVLEVLEQLFEQLSLEPPSPDLLDAIALDVSHELVENGIDILMKRIDPMIGQKIMFSALLRSPELPYLLVRAYAADFSDHAGISFHKAAKIITSAETEFRRSMIFYGQALLQDDATSIELISEQTANVAKSFLAAYGIEIPAEIDVTPFVKFLTQEAMAACADDFAFEVTATVGFVNENLAIEGVSY
jgi:hypothetical protein